VRTLVFLPVVTSQVVVATMWTFMLGRQGLFNSVLGALGIEPVSFLANKHLALLAIIIMTVWQQVGLACVIFLGGLQRIPAEIEESAALDGAGPWRRMWSIVMPLVSRTTVVIAVVITVFALQAFAPAYIMTGGAPEGSTNLIVYHIYKTAFVLQDPGYASALSIVVLAFALVVSLAQAKILRADWTY
jgi:ABC-type sugar transport system permease subunit